MNSALEWLLGYGYVRLREQLHRAEESALLIADREALIAEATRDLLRLQDSNIANAEQLREQLDRARATLASTMGVAIAGLVPASAITGVIAGLNLQPNAPDADVARRIVAQVRRAINEYRDERRYALVRARNQLLRTIFLAGMVTYALLVFALLVPVGRDAIISAVSFFLVGAVVGLFNRLYLDAAVETAVEDYGLSVARLLHTPLLCGLAALGGSLIIPLLSVQINPTPGSIVAGQQTILTPTLESIFNVAQRPFSLVLAAVFGLTPSALISRLQNEAEKYKSDLKSSQAPTTE
jgi:uncharacterized membrane protein